MLGLAALTLEISTAAPVVLPVTDHVRVPPAGTVEVASDKAKTCDAFVSQACLSAPAFDAGFWLSVTVTVSCAVTQLGPVAGLLTRSLSVTEPKPFRVTVGSSALTFEICTAAPVELLSTDHVIVPGGAPVTVAAILKTCGAVSQTL